MFRKVVNATVTLSPKGLIATNAYQAIGACQAVLLTGVKNVNVMK